MTFVQISFDSRKTVYGILPEAFIFPDWWGWNAVQKISTWKLVKLMLYFTLGHMWSCVYFPHSVSDLDEIKYKRPAHEFCENLWSEGCTFLTGI